MLNPHGYSRARLLLEQARDLLEGKQPASVTAPDDAETPDAQAEPVVIEQAQGLLFEDGARRWIVDGVLHRQDGPAIEYPSGLGEGWVRGVFQGYHVPAWKPQLALEVFGATIDSIEKWAMTRPAQDLALRRTQLNSSYAALLDAMTYGSRLGKEMEISPQEAADLYKHADALLSLSDQP